MFYQLIDAGIVMRVHGNTDADSYRDKWPSDERWRRWIQSLATTTILCSRDAFENDQLIPPIRATVSTSRTQVFNRSATDLICLTRWPLTSLISLNRSRSSSMSPKGC